MLKDLLTRDFGARPPVRDDESDPDRMAAIWLIQGGATLFVAALVHPGAPYLLPAGVGDPLAFLVGASGDLDGSREVLAAVFLTLGCLATLGGVYFLHLGFGRRGLGMQAAIALGPVGLGAALVAAHSAVLFYISDFSFLLTAEHGILPDESAALLALRGVGYSLLALGWPLLLAGPIVYFGFLHLDERWPTGSRWLTVLIMIPAMAVMTATTSGGLRIGMLASAAFLAVFGGVAYRVSRGASAPARSAEPHTLNPPSSPSSAG